VENANVLPRLEQELQNSPLLAAEERIRLQAVLRSGHIVPEALEVLPAAAAVSVGP
jgi:hypothetical protein